MERKKFYIQNPEPSSETYSKDEWKKKNLLELEKRLNGWQLKSFKESYKHKIENGISLFKKENQK